MKLFPGYIQLYIMRNCVQPEEGLVWTETYSSDWLLVQMVVLMAICCRFSTCDATGWKTFLVTFLFTYLFIYLIYLMYCSINCKTVLVTSCPLTCNSVHPYARRDSREKYKSLSVYLLGNSNPEPLQPAVTPTFNPPPSLSLSLSLSRQCHGWGG